ncbi:MAG TPA: phosphatidylserine/phosphatidylglycerophosphate/cardiolipin synthase family protein, partial [Candidatus Wallbacteria bacterium]|nr:phosphatidylserine/phosphatidylglycerophosphate/cardiolipin synthase family protein [Candidatus Wallbacteria bacterium]
TYAERYKEALDKYQAQLKGSQQAAETALDRAAASEQSGRIDDQPQAETSRTSSLSGELGSLVKALHSTGARDKADAIIAKLEEIIKTSSSGEEVIDAKIELANAYAKFKLDYNKAVELLSDVVKTASGKKREEAGRALERAKYSQTKTQLAGLITQKRAEAQSKKQTYQQYEWLKNPIKKVGSLASYYKSLFTYRKAIADHRSYRETGEKDPNYVNYEFLSDVFGKRAEFGVADTFDNTTMPVDDAYAQIRLITNNNEAWYARWYMLNAARNTIDMTYFIFEKDAYGKAMLGLLMKKANEGVKIRLMIDARGSKALAKTFMGQDYLQKLMTNPNVQIRVFNPMHKALPSTFTNIRNLIGSNHQKIIVVDGEISMTGGRNVSLNYFADPDDDPNVFRDTDVILKGSEIAGKMKEAFDEEFEALENFEISKDLFGNWSGKDKELIAAEKAMDMWIKGMGPLNDPVLKEVNAELFKYKKMVNYQGYDPFENSHYAAVKLYGKHNFQQERNDITDNLVAFMDACTQEIIVQNPYVILTEKSRAALKRASDRGVKIIIHTNSPVSTDSILTQAFFLKDWKEVMKALPNARVFVFVGKNKLHAKVFVFDKTVSVVGTYNMDYMSEQINGEDVCAIKSAEFSKDCRDRIFEDIAQSKEYKIGVNEKGEPYEIYGPGSFTDKKTMFILETLMKLNILKPLI